jgi:hypothetical protein
MQPLGCFLLPATLPIPGGVSSRNPQRFPDRGFCGRPTPTAPPFQNDVSAPRQAIHIAAAMLDGRGATPKKSRVICTAPGDERMADDVARNTLSLVIPGQPAGLNPESITTTGSVDFRVRADARPGMTR